MLAASLYTPYRLAVLAACSLLVFQPLQAHDWAKRPQTWGRVTVLAPLFALCLVAMFPFSAAEKVSLRVFVVEFRHHWLHPTNARAHAPKIAGHIG